MSGKNNGHEHKTLMERSKDEEKKLEEDEPIVLDSSASDPIFPAMQEYEVDEGGFKGSKKKHPGLIWAIIAILAVIVLCICFAASGDWFTPKEAQQVANSQFEEETGTTGQ